VGRLMDIFKETRPRAWEEQPGDSFDGASIDADATMAPGDGWREQGVDISREGEWGHHPPVVSPANTAEPLSLLDRGGNRPSREHADVHPDKAGALRRRAGSEESARRGDTGFTQAGHLDRRDRDSIRFLFGIDAMANLGGLAERLPDLEYGEWERPPRPTIETVPRRARERHEEQVVGRRRPDALEPAGEEVAGFEYRPVAREESRRAIVSREKPVVGEGQSWPFEPGRYHSHITNDRAAPASEIAFLADDRRDQGSPIGQLEGGVKALAMPVGDLASDGASMVMASLGWGLEARAASPPPEQGRWAEEYRAEERSPPRMESSTSRVAAIQVPRQIARASRRLIYRSPSWSPWRGVFPRPVGRLHGRRMCRGVVDVKPGSGCPGPCWPRIDEGGMS